MHTLTIEPHDSDPFVVLKATGELDLATQDQFEQVVAGHLDSSPVVVDLSGVEFVDISALRSLVICHGLAGTSGHELFYADASRQALRLLSVAELDSVLPMRLSVAEAVCSSR